MSFRLSGLPLAAFAPLFALDAAGLAAVQARRITVRAGDDFPCRVSLTNARPGETVVLANYLHQPADTPYRARGPLFVREAAAEAHLAPGEVPEGFRDSLLAVRAYDAEGMILAAEVTPGAALEAVLLPYLARMDTAYVHLHYARRGCYAARADRIG